MWARKTFLLFLCSPFADPVLTPSRRRCRGESVKRRGRERLRGTTAVSAARLGEAASSRRARERSPIYLRGGLGEGGHRPGVEWRRRGDKSPSGWATTADKFALSLGFFSASSRVEVRETVGLCSCAGPNAPSNKGRARALWNWAALSQADGKRK